MRIGSGWNAYTTLVGAGDLTGDGHPDLLARDTCGVLWLYAGTGNTSAPYNHRIRIGSGWNIYTALVVVGDVTDDGHPDLVARDHNGVLWLYTGAGGSTPLFEPRTRIGSGGNEYNSLLLRGFRGGRRSWSFCPPQRAASTPCLVWQVKAWTRSRSTGSIGCPARK